MMTEQCSGPQGAIAVRRSLASFLGESDGDQMVSAGDAIDHLRTTHPALKCSDRRLVDIIAGAAIIADLDMGWDAGANRALYDRWADRQPA